eukprot:SM000016S01859  [mRNA]  locus=s16:267026:268741:- [translate_table: standard]
MADASGAPYSPMLFLVLHLRPSLMHQDELVKRLKGRKPGRSQGAAQEADVDDELEAPEGLTAEQQLSELAAVTSGRDQRKLNKQLKFLKKLQENQLLLSVKKDIKKKPRRGRKAPSLALESISKLAEHLPPTSEKKPPRIAKVLGNKARQSVAVMETQQLGAVLAHPMFKANAFAAIKEHLHNTLPPPIERIPFKGSSKMKGKKRGQKTPATGAELPFRPISPAVKQSVPLPSVPALR